MTIAMPFGQYRGTPLERIRTTYLFWLAEILEDPDVWAELRELGDRHGARDRLYQAVLEELEFRRIAPEGHDTVGRDLEPAEREWLYRLVEAGYRELARQHHPDRGGELRQMQELNDAIDRIRSAIKS